MADTTAQDLRTALVGAWHLESYESCADDGSDVWLPLGDRPTGIILYTPDGYMSAQLMRSGRALLPVPDPHGPPGRELAGAAAAYLSYAGPYTVDGNVVAHHVQVGLTPNWVGRIQYRAAVLDGSTLTLGPTEPTLIGGQYRNATLVWRRA